MIQSRGETGKFKKTHGLSKSRIYNLYSNMINRCYNPAHKSYRDYNRLGVCDEWLKDGGLERFNEFMLSIGWTEECTLQMDRIDNTLGYISGNIRLTTPSVNIFNTRRLRSDNNSGYRGVSLHRGKFRALICVHQKQIHIGIYPTAKKAAIARDRFIIENNVPGAHLQVLSR